MLSKTDADIQNFLFFVVDLLSISTFGLIHTNKQTVQHVDNYFEIRSISRLTAVILEFQIGQLNFEIGRCRYPVSKLRLWVPTDIAYCDM